MSSSNIEIFRSGTFNFDIGPSRTRFTLHKKLVSRHSEPLDRLMHGGFKESQLGVGTIDDIEPETFARFAEYIYSGDYSVAEPLKNDVGEEDQGSSTDEAAWTWKSARRKKPRGLAQLSLPSLDRGEAVEVGSEAEEASAQLEGQPPDSPTDSIPPEAPEPDMPFSPVRSASLRSSSSGEYRHRPVSPQHVPFQLDPAPGPNKSASDDYSPVFMCHAQVYVFAQEFIIPDLRTLAASKLSDSLNLFHCYSRRAGDITRLIRHVYTNTPDPDSAPSPLREVVVSYAANNFKVLISSTEFEDLLAGKGSFAPDVCRKVARML